MVSINRAVLISKAVVQQGSVETLYQNGNSLEQIAGFTVVARYRGHLYSASSQGLKLKRFYVLDMQWEQQTCLANYNSLYFGN